MTQQQQRIEQVRAYVTRKQKQCQERWKEIAELTQRLKLARIRETDEAVKFKLEKQIEELQADETQMEQELQEIELDLRDLNDPKRIAVCLDKYPLPLPASEERSDAVATIQRHIHAARDYFERVAGDVTIQQAGRDIISGDKIEKHIVHNYAGASQAEDAKMLQKAYLSRVLQRAMKLELTGIDRKSADYDKAACLNLGSIYTALLTLSSEHADMMGKETMSAVLREEKSQQLSALDLLNRHSRLVLLGDPGSGKSTFVKFVAMCLAGEALGEACANLQDLTAPLPDKEGKDAEEPQPWEHGALLPVCVILRDFAARGLPADGRPAMAKHLWEFIAGSLEADLVGDYAPYLKKHLHEQGGLILLDGLDEVPEAEERRVQIKQAVEDFALTFPKCRMLVTSRIYAYQRQDWRLSNFAEAVLAPFSVGQIRRFVDQWYAHIADVRDKDHDDFQGRAELLKRAIFSNARLYDFAERPLLLTLMASLHA